MADASNKIWIIKTGRSLHLCRNEADMLRRTNSTSTRQEILEYNLISSQKVTDFYKARDRDNQLKTILGELDKSEVSIVNLINLYDKYAPEGKTYKNHYLSTEETTTDKSLKLAKLRKYQNSKIEISRILIKEKKHFMTLSTEVEWLTAILSCHNFTDHIYDYKKWDQTLKKYTPNDSASDELRNNFKLAKEELKKNRKKEKMIEVA